MKERLKSNKRKIITVILILFSLIIISAPLFLRDVPLLDISTNKIDIIEKISQIMATVFVVVGSIIAVWQYYITSKSEIIKIEVEKVQKAIDLSEYYKNEVLTPFSIVREVYISAGIFGFLQKEKSKMKDFDVEEMNDIFSQQELQQLRKLYSSKEFISKIVEMNEALNLQIYGCASSEIHSEDGINKKTITVDVNKAMNDFFNRYVINLMNNIEQFAMYFTHNVADESVVYQSLYPSYIEMCRTLYYDISKCSELGKPKLYRNLQGLYEIWLKKSNNTKQNIKAEETNRGTVPKDLS